MASKVIKPRLSFYLILSILIFFLAAPASAADPAGSIDGVTGTAYYRPKGSDKWAIALKGQALAVGDRVKTGSDGRASLLFSEGSKISIGNESELEVTEFLIKKKKRSAVYSLSAGKMRAAISKFSGSSDIKVKTPTSVSGVKGTEFIVMNQGSANVLFGKEDAVTVSGNDSKTVMLTPGTMTENTRGGSPIEPVAVDPGSALEEVRSELEALTDTEAPVEWERAGKLPLILARWNVNYGHYLADGKKYSGALDVFQIAIDLTDEARMRAEAHLERGTVLSRYMNKPEKALIEYKAVMEKYPEEPFLENALYSAGLIHMETGGKKNALKVFRKYLEDYPKGAHRETVEVFIRVLEKD